jgi:hypothetical protein
MGITVVTLSQSSASISMKVTDVNAGRATNDRIHRASPSAAKVAFMALVENPAGAFAILVTWERTAPSSVIAMDTRTVLE